MSAICEVRCLAVKPVSLPLEGIHSENASRKCDKRGQALDERPFEVGFRLLPPRASPRLPTTFFQFELSTEP